MAKKVKDLVVSTGTYQKDGKTKHNNINIGAILENDKGGKFMVLERWFNPAGLPNPDNRSTIIVSMFDVKDGEQTHKGFSKQGDVESTPALDAMSGEEIPF